MKRIVFFAAVLALAFPFYCNGSDFRCGSEVIQVGDSPEMVRKLCGKPSHISSSKAKKEKDGNRNRKKSRIRDGNEESSGTTVKRWHYDRGYGDYVYVLTFRGNSLKKIEIASRGGK